MTKRFTNILINNKHYKVEGTSATGAALKELANIAPQNLLFREAHGPGDDEQIADDKPVQLRNGDRFYDMPQGNFGVT